MAYGIVRTDRVQATKDGALESVKFYNGSTATAIENGMIVELAGLDTSEREIMKGQAVTALTNEVVLVAGVELMYDESTRAKGLDDFINVAGKPFRAYHLKAGDVFSVSDANVAALAGGTPVVGNYVIAKVGTTKFDEKTTLGGTERFVGKVIAKEVLGSRAIPLTVIQVVKA